MLTSRKSWATKRETAAEAAAGAVRLALLPDDGPTGRVSDPVPLDMLTMRGCAERRSAGSNALVTATTPKTLVSYVRRKTSTSVSIADGNRPALPRQLPGDMQADTAGGAGDKAVEVAHAPHDRTVSFLDLVRG